MFNIETIYIDIFIFTDLRILFLRFDSDAAREWEAATPTTNFIKPQTSVQNIPVRIAGHILNVGIVNRKVTVTKDGTTPNIVIEW